MLSQRKSTKVNESQRKSTKVNKGQQRSKRAGSQVVSHIDSRHAKGVDLVGREGSQRKSTKVKKKSTVTNTRETKSQGDG